MCQKCEHDLNTNLYTCFELLLFLHYLKTTYIFIISHNLDYVRCRVPWVGSSYHDKIDHNKTKQKKLPMVSTLIVGFHTMRKLHTLT